MRRKRANISTEIAHPAHAIAYNQLYVWLRTSFKHAYTRTVTKWKSTRERDRASIFVYTKFKKNNRLWLTRSWKMIQTMKCALNSWFSFVSRRLWVLHAHRQWCIIAFFFRDSKRMRKHGPIGLIVCRNLKRTPQSHSNCYIQIDLNKCCYFYFVSVFFLPRFWCFLSTISFCSTTQTETKKSARKKKQIAKYVVRFPQVPLANNCISKFQSFGSNANASEWCRCGCV